MHFQGALEASEGRSLFDYVRRLSQRMQATQKLAGAPFRAIGVLSSDVYDKLVIIEALRSDFPDAVFFTTDLDSRLLADRHLDHTRNLLVASGFGLRLIRRNGQNEKGLAWSLPPFRDAHQTALFRAGCLALFPGRGGARAGEEYPIVPRVYEIGRTHAVPLRSPADQPAPAGNGLVDWASRSVPGPIFGWWGAPRWLAVLIVIAGILGIVAWIVPQHGPALRSLIARLIRRGDKPGFTHPPAHPFLDAHFWKVQLGTVGVLLVAGFAPVYMGNDGLEPLVPSLWLEGVSVWPTELVRWLTSLFCACSLIGIHFLHRHLLHEIEARFHLGGSDTAEATSETTNATRVWKEFRRRNEWPSWGLNCIRLLLCYTALVWGGLALVGEFPVPYRGSGAYVADVFFRYLSCLAFGLLLIRVAVVIRETAWLIRQWTPKSTDWPRELLERVEKERGLPPGLAHGWLDMELIGQMTTRIGSFVYLPITALFMLYWAHSRWFDNWTLGPTLGLFFGLHAAAIVGCMLVVQRLASNSRQAVLAKLQPQLHLALSQGEPHGNPRLIQRLIDEVTEYRVGAFAPIWEQAVVTAVLIPLGGTGSVAILERVLSGR
jgi:hypothetical protein